MCENKKHVIQGKIIHNKNVAPDHFEMKIASDVLPGISRPGQFVNVKINNEAQLLRVPLGIHDAGPGYICLLYKVVGEATHALKCMGKDDMVDVLGPLGNSFNIGPVEGSERAKAFLVAGGHGIAPLYFLARVLTGKGIDTEVFIGARSASHVVCADKTRDTGAKVHISTESGDAGHKGYVTGPLTDSLKARGKGATTIFACGPRSMLAAVSGVADEYGIPAEVSVDAYMACGIGACLGCAIRTRTGYKLVCKDGPVFDHSIIDWAHEKANG
ncbi:MAG: dihydroorotate dehydrogenase electron transfer subunit [Candidatus Omnitrophica bacterium]|nr:dihydroorotate dehydrogenase electron transfer subunit [Candidatus Omnitrophota bacterium]